MHLIIIDGLFENKKNIENSFLKNNLIPSFVKDDLEVIQGLVSGENDVAIVTGPYLKEKDAITFNKELSSENNTGKPLHLVYNKKYNPELFNFLVNEGVDFCVYGSNFAEDIIKFCNYYAKSVNNKIKVFPIGKIGGDTQIIRTIMKRFCFSENLKGTVFFEACVQIALSNDKVKTLKNDIFPVVAENFHEPTMTIKKEVDYAVKDAYNRYHLKRVKGPGRKDEFIYSTSAKVLSLVLVEIKSLV